MGGMVASAMVGLVSPRRSTWLLGATSLCWLVCFSECRLHPRNGVDRGQERISSQTIEDDSQQYDPNTALLLTPLIEDGQLLRGRTLSRVNGVPGMNRPSYSGFLTARPEDEANLFFWFFPADVNSSSAPVLLWLNGGPGASSLGGLFGENGPYTVTPNLKLKYRRDHWATVFNMLYVDCPVGTGYSYAKSAEYYSNNLQAIGQDLYRVITQFFTLFDSYASNDFYIAGESYGAKYAAHLANIIHTRNANVTQKINMKGMVSLSGMLDGNILNRTIEYLYHVGLFGPEDYEAAKLINDQYSSALRNGNNREATDIYRPFWEAIGAANSPSLLTNASGITAGENMLLTVDPRVFLDFQKFAQKPRVRLAIHVGNLTFRQYNDDVFSSLLEEYTAISVLGILENLLDDGYKVLVMSGNLDFFVPPLTFRDQTVSLRLKYAANFRNSSRVIWKVKPDDVDVADYSNCAFNLCLVMVRNAGHRMPNDQVRSTLDAVRRFVFDVPFQRPLR